MGGHDDDDGAFLCHLLRGVSRVSLLFLFFLLLVLVWFRFRVAAFRAKKACLCVRSSTVSTVGTETTKHSTSRTPYTSVWDGMRAQRWHPSFHTAEGTN